MLLTPRRGSFHGTLRAAVEGPGRVTWLARSIYWKMLTNDYPYVYLDIASHKKPQEIRDRFPQIYENCRKRTSISPTQPIPVCARSALFLRRCACRSQRQEFADRPLCRRRGFCYRRARRQPSGEHLSAGRMVWGYRAAEHIRTQSDENHVTEADVRNGRWKVCSTIRTRHSSSAI